VMADMPAAAGQMLIALDFQLGPVTEVVVVGERPDVRPAVALLTRGFRPHQMLAWRPAEPAAAALAEKSIPLLVGREPRGLVTTYVCRNFTCAAPIVGVEGLETL
jgi:uncharacterized protein